MAKLLLICLTIFLSSFSSVNTEVVFADESAKQYYAKIQSDEVFFYSQPNSSEEFRVFKIPTSYFVLLTADANDKFYSCKYGDKNGYVKKEEVSPMNGTPLSPYATFATTQVLAPDGLDMRSTPYKTPVNIETRIAFLDNNLLYYGSLDGEDFIPKKTTTWYYCKYINPTTSQSQFGYLYSFYCEKPDIKLNMEEFDVITTELFPANTPQPQPSTSLSGTAKTFIVIGVSLPCVVILYLLIKPTLMSEHSGKKQAKAKPIKRRRHGDYFEFDDSDLN